jgi:hypothetical protein
MLQLTTRPKHFDRPVALSMSAFAFRFGKPRQLRRLSANENNDPQCGSILKAQLAIIGRASRRHPLNLDPPRR